MSKRIEESDLFKPLDFKDLRRGNIIQNIGSGTSYVVTEVKEDNAIAVRQINVTNDREWRVLRDSKSESND